MFSNTTQKMYPHNKLMLLFISLYLVASCSSATPQLSPGISPSPQTDQSYLELSPSPSSSHVSAPQSYAPVSTHDSASLPSPFSEQDSDQSSSPSPAATDLPLNYVSLSPSNSDPPSDSISPNADAPSESNDDDHPSPLDFPSMLSSVKVDPKINKICESTDHPALCIATVAPLLIGKNVDVKSVLEVVVKASSTFTQFVLSLANKLVENPGTPPELKSILSDCKDSYDSAMSNFEETMTALQEDDIGTMNSMLSAVMTFVGDCEDSFVGLGTESPFSDYSEKLTNMTSNCLAIVSLMN